MSISEEKVAHRHKTALELRKTKNLEQKRSFVNPGRQAVRQNEKVEGR